MFFFEVMVLHEAGSGLPGTGEFARFWTRVRQAAAWECGRRGNFGKARPWCDLSPVLTPR